MLNHHHCLEILFFEADHGSVSIAGLIGSWSETSVTDLGRLRSRGGLKCLRPIWSVSDQLVVYVCDRSKPSQIGLWSETVTGLGRLRPPAGGLNTHIQKTRTRGGAKPPPGFIWFLNYDNNARVQG